MTTYTLQSLENPTIKQWDAGERGLRWENVMTKAATPGWLDMLQTHANQNKDYRKMRIIDADGNAVYEVGETKENSEEYYA